MKKRFPITLTILLLMCSLAFGCGSNSTETISAEETVQDVVSNQEVQEEVTEQPRAEETTTGELTTDTENLSVEEEKISVESEEESEELSDKDAEELFWEEYKGDVRDVDILYETLHQLDDIGMYGPVKVPDEVKEEYEKRIEEGFSYNPEEVYNNCTDYSDAEIIEMVNARYLELHNEKRKELELGELKLDDRLNNVADIRAEEASYFFNHTRPNGEWAVELIPWDGVSYQLSGENISYVVGCEDLIDYYYGSKSIIPERRFYIDIANDGFELLWNSPPHYENITHPEYKYIGIDSYIVRDKNGVIMIVTAFEFASDVF